MRILPIILSSTFLLISCGADNTDTNTNIQQNKNIFSGSIQNNETPATERTETGTFATGTTDSGSVSTSTGLESDSIDDSTPPEATGVFVR